MTLLEKLEAAGLTVEAESDWETATNRGRDRSETVGVLNHWDAIAPRWAPDAEYYKTGNRYGHLIYHIVIKRDGTLMLLSQRYVWHAGDGDPRILEHLRRAEKLPEPRVLDHQDEIVGNPYTFGVSIQYHPSYDPPLQPSVQYDALVKTNRVLLEHFDLSINQITDHAGWTHRKWDIDPMDMGRFHSDILDVPHTIQPTPDWTKELIMALPTLARGDGYSSENKAHLRPDVKRAQGLLLANGHKDENTATPETATDGWFGPGTDDATRDFQEANHLAVDGIVGPKTWTALLGE